MAAAVRVTLIVLYSTRVEACREFYGRLGLDFVRERHGEAGYEHYAAPLADGGVFEIYPATPARVTGAVRLGLAVGPAVLPPGRHVLRDPDGRVVDVVSG
ncbi:MAG: VOC family protein [Streptomycetaceae bacterium]|nr:VOC family protein [Streptomycetaceae bacterium]